MSTGAIPLAVEPVHLELVKAILRRITPACEVRAFGSRVTGAAKPYSDLDLCIRCACALPLAMKAELAEAFSESDLPWRVDIADWSALSETFQRAVIAQSVVLQAASGSQG